MSRTKKIELLSPDQAARLAAVRDTWLARGLETGPCDRAAMERAADEAYRCAGLNPTQLKIWLESPFAGAIGAHLLTHVPKQISGAQVWDQVRAQVGAQVGDQVRDQVWDQVRAQVGAQVGDQVWDQVWAQVRDQVLDLVGDQVWDQVWAQVRDQVGDLVGDQVWDQVWAQVRDQVWDQVWDQVRDQVGRAGYGQHDASWLAFYDFFSNVCGLEICNKLRGLNLLAECGWWWPFAGAVILTERPNTLLRDDRGRLHNTTGAAVGYPDGFALYAVHGVRVAADIITNHESITIERIAGESNAEVRRVMIERYGVARYLMDSGATIVNHDGVGILYRHVIPNDEPIVMVRVLNSTPEPDGVMTRDEAIEIFGSAAKAAAGMPATTRWKEYMIRVNPAVRTAREAVAWTFHMPADEYVPALES